ncbi:molecular chaperone TorD [Veronia pacifica]|uniref:Chaperone protein TorD n=1 Tax=Veronia pacifica TaxID=1080227 RepID=A0A1C3EBT5_9GAMM|nr:molecular chaperone TorD [Veronia pacifica]ODA30701.1 molecular chaperone TorD [Veronia pacifica]
MQDFIAINEQRAEFYWWMSSLFANELTEENLSHYHGAEMFNYLSNLALTPELVSPVALFKDALAKLKRRDDAQLELAADFCGLFLSTPKTGALPYASLYLCESGLLNEKPAQDMAAWMEKYQIAQRKEFNEPGDHLAVILDFMGNLIILANSASTDEKREALMLEQTVFITDMMASWLPTFTDTVKRQDKFGFYHAAAALLVGFIQLDTQFLKGE